jgi:transposase
VHTLCPVSRFANNRKVTAYVGLEPREHSSGERRRMGHISKAGSRVLRFLLVEADNSAVRSDEALRRLYYRVLHRRDRARAKPYVRNYTYTLATDACHRR